MGPWDILKSLNMRFSNVLFSLFFDPPFYLFFKSETKHPRINKFKSVLILPNKRVTYAVDGQD